ncbi:DUF262 domain-containing protein [bacterium]|nr:DUF262 domain-containing protein [bacterium]
MTIRELLDGIEKLDYVLPEFQREYIWGLERAKQLLVSLFKKYPTGSLLVWKTQDPPEIKNNAIDRDRIGTTAILLDGQQRLTTLYLLVKNKIPPYYKQEEIANDPRQLFFNVSSGKLLYYQAIMMQNNPEWVSVTDCFNTPPPSVFDIAKKTIQENEDPFKKAENYNKNLNELRNIVERDYPIQYVPTSATIDEAIDVFDRVNSLGTKLTDAELALTHITGKWPQARREMKSKISSLARKDFFFDLTFFVRSLVGIVKGKAIFEAIHSSPAEEIRYGWDKLSKYIDYLMMILPKHAFVHSSEDLTTTNVLVPAVVYLSQQNGKITSDRELRRFIHWMYAAMAWARYSGQTDQRLDHDISIILRGNDPWDELINAIIEQRGRIDLSPSDLEGRNIGHPLYRIFYILCKRNGAIDWTNGLPIEIRNRGSYAIHNHHIFPQSVLYKEGGYDSRNHLHKKIVNEIANRAFISAETNWAQSNTPPSIYLAEIVDKYPGALEKQFIPTDPYLWEINRYEDFIRERRRKIADAFNTLMDTLLESMVISSQLDIHELVKAGESASLEYKMSLRWDYRENKVNKILEKVILKTIAGFLNNEGGILLIGVSDDGSVCGLTKDYQTLNRQNRDGFEQKIVELISSMLGAEFIQYIHIDFEQIDLKDICKIEVESSPRPTYLQSQGSKEFYIRVGNTTRALDIEATQNYIGMHWA